MELDARTNCLSQLRDFKRWQDRVTSLIFRHGSPSTSLVVMRAAIFHTVGGFDETLPNAQDYNLFLRMSLHGHWMFVPGLQVIRRNYLDELYGGAPQITQHATPQVGNLLVQAKMLERFIHEQGGRAVIPGYIWRRKLSRVWYSVGCLLRTRGQTIEARDCYLRAIRACPWHVKAWRNYLGYSPTR
jgi:GT2 family glycosyltransferase